MRVRTRKLCLRSQQRNDNNLSKDRRRQKTENKEGYIIMSGLNREEIG